jgi:hypothetical protein
LQASHRAAQKKQATWTSAKSQDLQVIRFHSFFSALSVKDFIQTRGYAVALSALIRALIRFFSVKGYILNQDSFCEVNHGS